MAGTSPDPALSPDCLEEGALRALLEDRQHHEWEDHLGRCPTCRSRLQSLAGGEITIPSRSENPRSEALANAITSLKISPFESSSSLENWLEPSPDENTLGLLSTYHILRILAEGGMGLILEAYDPVLDREVAIKLIKPREAGSDLARERMLREARAVAAIEHESVVPIYAAEISEKTGAIFIVMPLVSGGNLQDRLDTRSAPFPPEEIISLGRQIASGLAAVHAQGILHRDIKPANILMREDDKIWLADFGIARSDDDQRLTNAGQLHGTPQFMSPEQVNGEECDPRSDLFGLGSVLYQLATGESAFSRDSALKTARAIADRPHRPVSSLATEIPKFLAELIDALLEKNPSRRPQNAEEVVARLSSGQPKRNYIPSKLVVVSLISLLVVFGAFFTNDILNSTPATPEIPSGNFTNAQAKQSYDTLDQAITAASPGDTITIQVNGHIDCESLPTLDKHLILRAAEGFEPTLVSTNSHRPLLRHTAPLILEGLKFNQQVHRQSPPPLVRSESSLFAAHCSFIRNSPPLRPGARPHSGIITTIGAERIEFVNSAIAAMGSKALTLTTGIKEVQIRNTLIATPFGLLFRHKDSHEVKVRLDRISFHGKGLAAWDRLANQQVAPVDFKLTHSAVETGVGIFGLRVSSLASVKASVKFEGRKNIYSPGTPFLLLPSSGSDQQIVSLEDWQEFWPLGDKESQLCEMDLNRRIRTNQQKGNLTPSDLRPSAKAAQNFPERGIDPEIAGTGKKYQKFRKTEAYQTWIKRAKVGWPKLTEKK